MTPVDQAARRRMLRDDPRLWRRWLVAQTRGLEPARCEAWHRHIPRDPIREALGTVDRRDEIINKRAEFDGVWEVDNAGARPMRDGPVPVGLQRSWDGYWAFQWRQWVSVGPRRAPLP